MSRRAWIKIHCEPWLDKSVLKLTLSERGAWITLLCIAGNSDFGDIGVLQSTTNRGISVQHIAFLMDISVKQCKRYLDRFVQLDMLELQPNNVIKITNWSKYQSEYGRQKSYRVGNKPKLQPKLHVESKSKSKKKDIHQSDVFFDAFWKLYPKKLEKKKARKAWSKIKPTNGLNEKIMTSLQDHLNSKLWIDPQFIPHPTTWLNGERWNDEIETPDEWQYK